MVDGLSVSLVLSRYSSGCWDDGLFLIECAEISVMTVHNQLMEIGGLRLRLNFNRISWQEFMDCFLMDV